MMRNRGLFLPAVPLIFSFALLRSGFVTGLSLRRWSTKQGDDDGLSRGNLAGTEEISKAVKKAEAEAEREVRHFELLRSECQKETDSAACIAEKSVAARLRRLKSKVDELRQIELQATGLKGRKETLEARLDGLEDEEHELDAGGTFLDSALEEAKGRREQQKQIAKEFKKKAHLAQGHVQELEAELASAKERTYASQERAIEVEADADSVKTGLNATDTWSEARLEEANRKEGRAHQLLKRAKEIGSKTQAEMQRRMDEERRAEEEDEGLINMEHREENQEKKQRREDQESSVMDEYAQNQNEESAPAPEEEDPEAKNEDAEQEEDQEEK